MVALANFSKRAKPVRANELRLYGPGYRFTDLVAERPLVLGDADVTLEPYQVMWLEAEG